MTFWYCQLMNTVHCLWCVLIGLHKVSHTTSVNNHFLHHGCVNNVPLLFMRLWWWDFVLTGEFSDVLLWDGVCLPAFSPDTTHRPPGEHSRPTDMNLPGQGPGSKRPLASWRHAFTVFMTWGSLRACDITVSCAVLQNVSCLRKETAPPSHMDRDNLPSSLMTTVVGWSGTNMCSIILVNMQL